MTLRTRELGILEILGDFRNRGGHQPRRNITTEWVIAPCPIADCQIAMESIAASPASQSHPTISNWQSAMKIIGKLLILWYRRFIPAAESNDGSRSPEGYR
jgi:hypothetical protein